MFTRYVQSVVTVAQLSFRLGGTDGVSVEAAKWAGALRSLGCVVRTVAGDGPVDRVVPGLAWGAAAGPDRESVEAALDNADVVVVENLCSLPLNPRAAAVVADVLRGRPALMHHFDLPWQRARFASTPFDGPWHDPPWAHVCINRLSAGELAARRGIEADVLYNAFDLDVPGVSQRDARRMLGWPDDGLLVLQPTRAIERKNIGAGLALAAALGASYWLTGPAEEGYEPPLDASVTVRWERCDDMALAYAACDVVAFPSSVEGFGNPVLESAVHRRPLAVLGYPVLDELAGFGLQWLRADEPDGVRAWLSSPAESRQKLLAANREVAREHFSLADLPGKLASLFERQGWGL